MLDSFLAIADLILLVAIWFDGRKMLLHEKAGAEYAKKTFELYVKYFERKEIERSARNEARRRIRAAKKEENSREPVSATVPEVSAVQTEEGA